MIIAAAIRQGDKIYSLPAPARHHDILRWMNNEGVKYNPEDDLDCQGFVASWYGELRYVRRIPAKSIARENNQLLPRTSTCRELFSEDVW